MKKFGIRVTLTENNPMRLPHLLGEDWASTRWYETEQQRDAALIDMSRRLPNYREGDDPAQILTKIEQ